MKKALAFSALALWFGAINLQAQGLLPVKWKFSTGDTMEWARPIYDDKDWKEITAGTAWEKQGYENYDGYAWYRASIVIPSTLRKDAVKYGGLLLKLGKIDDVDLTYLNGELAGKTGGFPPHYITAYNAVREYSIPAGKILWDKPNLVAIRVFDAGGEGGICAQPVELVVKGISDNFKIVPSFKQQNHVLLARADCSVPLTITNSLPITMNGDIKISVISDFKQLITEQTNHVEIKKNSSSQINFPLKNIQPGFYKVSIHFAGEILSKHINFCFAYQPERIVSPVDAQPDFQNYWDRARKELGAVEPQYKVTKKDTLGTPTHNIYLVEMRSLGNILIRGWYSVPKKPGKYPAILKVQGYSSNSLPQDLNYGADFVSFALNIRGHGNSQDDVNPGFPGYLQNFLNDKELYIYRGAYMDCVRAMDFLCSRAEVDTSRIVVEGGSQGGALTFATAALDNKRIKLCIPMIPFLSDFPDYFKTAAWPANEFINLVEIEKKMSWEKVFYTLSYIDIKNLAPMIKAPMLMYAGLLDEICPPHINFAAYNNVTAKKEYVVAPGAGHDVTGEFDQYKMSWIRKNLGME